MNTSQPIILIFANNFRLLDKVLTLQQKKAELIVTSNALEVFDPMTSVDLFKTINLLELIEV